MPTLNLGSPIAYFDASKYSLMAITSSGYMHIWNVKSLCAMHPPVSLSGLASCLTPSEPTTKFPNGVTPVITSITVRPNGAPLVQISSGLALSYDKNLMSWVRVGDGWWAEGSTCWKGRHRTSSFAHSTSNNGSTSSASNGVVASVEARISESLASNVAGQSSEKQRPGWWGPALTLGHLETRMNAARVLESATEYRQALLQYARVIADEGFRNKAEELLRELYGPVYWYVSPKLVK